jgi:hypothetical protein
MIGFKGLGYQKKFTQCPIIDVLQSSSKLVHIRMVWNVDDLSLTNSQVPCYLFTAKLAPKTNLEPNSPVLYKSDSTLTTIKVPEEYSLMWLL